MHIAQGPQGDAVRGRGAGRGPGHRQDEAEPEGSRVQRVSGELSKLSCGIIGKIFQVFKYIIPVMWIGSPERSSNMFQKYFSCKGWCTSPTGSPLSLTSRDWKTRSPAIWTPSPWSDLGPASIQAPGMTSSSILTGENKILKNEKKLLKLGMKKMSCGLRLSGRGNISWYGDKAYF